MTQPVVFYDIPGNAHPQKAWSPNTQNTRYASRREQEGLLTDTLRYILNYKGIPYKTVWVEYPDIGEGPVHVRLAPSASLTSQPHSCACQEVRRKAH